MIENPYIQPASLLNHIKTVREGSISLSDMLNMYEARFEAIELHIESFIPEDNRFARLRQDAQILEEQYPDPESRPPLYGVLVGIKDIFHVDGFETCAGTKVPSDLFAGKEAIIATQLKQAGALIVGKTVTTEFAYFEPGPTRNPHNLDHTPGGSSSGSAAAIASGLVHLTTGTQTVGSVIRPAAYCGVVGYKPSYDRIDTAGLVYFSKSADHVGLFTQDVAGMQLVTSLVINDWDATIQPTHRPILGVPDGEYLQQSTAVDVFERQVQQLEGVGYVIKRIPFFEDIETIDSFHQDMIAFELAQEHEDWFKEHKGLYRPRTAKLIQYGQTISLERRDAGREHQLTLRERLHKAMVDNQIDIWICPSAPDVAPEGIHATGSPAMNMPWTHSGLPSITVPAGKGDKGLPLGLQICAKYGDDERLLAAAQEIEIIMSHR
jgi:Asp-tRNA(Asn)/Glu-tRNA(Gln) amidotransferase A subunit family amidase